MEGISTRLTTLIIGNMKKQIEALILKFKEEKEEILKNFNSVFGQSWRIRMLYEWFLDFRSNHPEWMYQWKANKQDKDDKDDVVTRSPKDSIYDAPKVDWGPFKRLPNVRNFKVDLGHENKLMALFGIKSKFKPTLKYEAYDNLGMNKYMNYQIYRLRLLAKSDPKEYFRVVNNLLRYSKVLFVIGLNHVNPRWHREMPLWKVIKLWKSHQRISQLKDWDVKHHRIYIDKDNGKKRPLGVPSLIWRIYIHQVSNFLSLYLEETSFFVSKKEGSTWESQHGFRTRLGTKTAWMEILKEVTKADWVFEFDLERCFSNIHIKGVSKALRIAKVPEGWISKFEHLNMVPVGNPADLRWDTKETNERNKFIESRLAISHPLVQRPNLLQQMKIEDRPNYQQASAEMIADKENYRFTVQVLKPGNIEWSFWQKRVKADTWSTLVSTAVRRRTFGLIASYVGTEGDPQRGLPQGLPTSPLLTVASLQVNFINKSPWKMIMYADDGIIYGIGPPPSREEIITRLSSDKWGITLNEAKSRFAKLPDSELDLKFLGLRLKGNILKGETRNASHLVYDKQNLVDIYDMLDNWNVIYRPGSGTDERREADEGDFDWEDNSTYYCYKSFCERNNRSSWVRLSESKLWGLIQARLFQSSWDIDIDQCFELTHSEGSWVDKRGRKQESALNVFNSTSFACHDLLDLLSKVKHKGRGKVA